jgi:tripartite-type tricarboxylate transporter receptor subunit TctC
MAPIANAVSLVKEGKLRALGVSSKDRDALVPDVPTVAEAGVPGYDSILWFGLLAPGRTPRALIGRLNTEVARILREPEVRTRWLPIGLEPHPTSPGEFDRMVASDIATFTKLARAGNIKAE